MNLAWTVQTDKKILCQADQGEEYDPVTEKMLQAQHPDGLAEWEHSQGSDTWLFDCDGLIPLTELLERCLEKEKVLKLFQSILELFKGLHSCMIPWERLVLEPQWILADAEDMWSYFLCVPLVRKNEQVSVSVFWQKLAEAVKPEPSMTSRYLTRLREGIAEMKEYSCQEMERLLAECTGQPEEPVQTDPLPLSAEAMGTIVWNHMRGMLTRRRNGEKYMLDKPEVILGKDYQSVDFYITDNATISRNHAAIKNKGASYFIADLNSTNHTYINGRVLQPQEEAELKNGDVLRLSNEEFLFQLV